MKKIQENMYFDVVFLYENVKNTLVYTFSPFNAHFSPLHHNGKGSITLDYPMYSQGEPTSRCIRIFGRVDADARTK